MWAFFVAERKPTIKELHERIQRYGADTLSTGELLACLLFPGNTRKDPLTHASHLLNTYGLTRLRTAEIAQLCTDGLTATQALRLKVASELVQRFTQGEADKPVQIQSADDAASLLRPLMMHLEQEQMRVLVLDSKNRVTANLLLYMGTINTTTLRIAELLRPVIVRNAAGLLIAHNHPSGDPTPSIEDLEVTQQLVKAAQMLEIDMLDHLIIGNPRYASLRQQIKW